MGLIAWDGFAQLPTSKATKDPMLPVGGKIVDGSSNLVGSSVKVFHDNELEHEPVSERSGKFQVGLSLGHLFTVQFDHLDT